MKINILFYFFLSIFDFNKLIIEEFMYNQKKLRINK